MSRPNTAQRYITYVSIPKGAIMSLLCAIFEIRNTGVSIPKGAIMRQLPNNSH